MSQRETTLQDHLAAIVTGLGYEFVGFEFSQKGNSGLLRVYIDSEKGITVDDCSRVSYQVSAMLDVEDPIQGHYNLEISSPGLDRPLFTIEHYKKQIGKRVKIRTHTPIENQRNFVGLLTNVEGNEIHVQLETKEIVLPFSDIEKAKVMADIR